MSRARRRYFWYALLLGLGILILFFGAHVRNVIRDAYAAEWAAGYVIDYMEEHPGDWPGSWSELKPYHDLAVKENGGPIRWETINDRVLIDWEADAEALVKQALDKESSSFQVIMTKSGAYWSGGNPNEIIRRWFQKNERVNASKY